MNIIKNIIMKIKINSKIVVVIIKIKGKNNLEKKEEQI